MIATTVNLLVYALPAALTTPETKSEKQSGKQKEIALAELELVETVERPSLPGETSGSSFRAARYHPSDSHTIYTVVNTVPPRTRKKSAPRQGFVCKWDTDKWEVNKHRKVSDRNVTCFDIR